MKPCRAAYAYPAESDSIPPACVVFIHGALNDHTVWTLLARWCANHGHGVLAVDLPGRMRSDGPALRDVEAMADWTLALLDAAGSAARGARRAQHGLARCARGRQAVRPETVSRLVMFGTCYPMAVPRRCSNCRSRRR